MFTSGKSPESHQTEASAQSDWIVENSADGILTIDSNRKIGVFNPSMEKLTGWHSEEVIGRTCSEVLNLRDRHGVSICDTKCSLECGEPSFHTHATIYTRYDQLVDVGISYGITFSDSDHIESAVLIVRDITHITQIDDLRSSLLAMVSHELQTPISIIKAYASTLARPDAKWSQQIVKDKLRAIEEESDRLSQVVSKLLYTSRIESGETRLNKMRIDLGKEATRLTNRFAEITNTHKFTIVFPPDFPPVFVDPEKLDEILTNLVENAIKFSPNGGTITISGNVLENQVLLSIADQGIGVRPEEGERLFERFYRAEDSAAAIQGTGLGLSICRTLIEAHGGHISIDGKPGRGACFTFSLPIDDRQ